MRQGTPCVAAVRLAGDWVRRRYVCEGKAAFDIQVILPVALGSSRLRPAVIYADAVAGSDPLHHAVEDLFSILTLIEAQITEVVQEAAGLGGDFRVNPGDIARERIGGGEVVLGFVAEPCVPVANRSKTDTVDRGIFRRVTKFINIICHERRSRRQQLNGGPVGIVLPSGGGDFFGFIVQVNAVRQGCFRFIKCRGRIGERVERFCINDILIGRASN